MCWQNLREGSIDVICCVPYYACDSVIFNYIISIPKEKREEFNKKLFDCLDSPTRNEAIRSMPLKHLFLQAIKDVEIVLGLHETLLNIVWHMTMTSNIVIKCCIFLLFDLFMFIICLKSNFWIIFSLFDLIKYYVVTKVKLNFWKNSCNAKKFYIIPISFS